MLWKERCGSSVQEGNRRVAWLRAARDVDREESTIMGGDSDSGSGGDGAAHRVCVLYGESPGVEIMDVEAGLRMRLACSVWQQLDESADVEQAAGVLLDVVHAGGEIDDSPQSKIAEWRIAVRAVKAAKERLTGGPRQSCYGCASLTIPLERRGEPGWFPCPVCGAGWSTGWPLWMRACRDSIRHWRRSYVSTGAAVPEKAAALRVPRGDEIPREAVVGVGRDGEDAAALPACPICDAPYRIIGAQPAPSCACWIARSFDGLAVETAPWGCDTLTELAPWHEIDWSRIEGGWSDPDFREWFGENNWLAVNTWHAGLTREPSIEPVLACLPEGLAVMQSIPVVMPGGINMAGSNPVWQFKDWFVRDRPTAMRELERVAAALRADFDRAIASVYAAHEVKRGT